MKFRSNKQSKRYKRRRDLVVQILDEFPVCERCSAARSTDVHELVRRSQWREGINHRLNLRALCRPCHIWVTEHPQEAYEQGWSAWSWGRDKYITHEEGRPD